MWTDDDRDMALAWQAEQALLCTGCGLPRDETMTFGDHDDFEVEAAECHACRARGEVADQWSGSRHGLFFTVTSNPQEVD